MPRSCVLPVSRSKTAAAQRVWSNMLTPRNLDAWPGWGGATALCGGGAAPSRDAPMSSAPASMHIVHGVTMNTVPARQDFEAGSILPYRASRGSPALAGGRRPARPYRAVN